MVLPHAVVSKACEGYIHWVLWLDNACVGGRGPIRTPKNRFFERFCIIKSHWNSFSLFCLLFPLASCCRTLPWDKWKKSLLIARSWKNMRTDRSFQTKKTFPQNPNILCDFFVQFNCRIEFCNILCRRAWLYIYIYIYIHTHTYICTASKILVILGTSPGFWGTLLGATRKKRAFLVWKKPLFSPKIWLSTFRWFPQVGDKNHKNELRMIGKNHTQFVHPQVCDWNQSSLLFFMESVPVAYSFFFFGGMVFFPACFRFRQDDEARSMGRVQADGWSCIMISWHHISWIYLEDHPS